MKPFGGSLLNTGGLKVLETDISISALSVPCQNEVEMAKRKTYGTHTLRRGLFKPSMPWPRLVE